VLNNSGDIVLNPAGNIVLNGNVKMNTTILASTGNMTLALSNANTLIRSNTTANRIFTIPTNSAVAFPIGTQIQFLRYHANSVTITPAAGVTLNGTSSSRQIASQYQVVAILKVETNAWVAIGPTV